MLALIAFAAARFAPIEISDRLLQFGVPAGLIAAAFILAPEPSRPGPVRRALSAGGDASYTLYLSHPFAANAVVLAWAHFGPAAPWLGLALAMTIAVAGAMIFYRTIERPVTEALQRAFGLRRSREAAVREAQMVAP
jgi:peptidoglycan/LPS O-acetylase OafA/YrhL